MTVFLVGAGPGDPRLITVRGLELVRSCELLVADRLVSQELIAEAPAEAEVVHRDALDQDALNELLVAAGREEKLVVRLKGGDPFLFGRGGEEAIALTEAGVPFEVVPGVSSLTAVPARAGIPVTQRGVAQRLTIVSGRSCDGTGPALEQLAHTPGTLVFFMALAGLREIADGLLLHGADPGLPAAVISNGTLPGERVVAAPLAELADEVEAAGLEPPALLVVGEVVRIRDQLAAFMHAGTGVAC
ncbi:MAG: uroporphyrinogen-III C-methyltransferase [Gaiellaceae bacterium]